MLALFLAAIHLPTALQIGTLPAQQPVVCRRTTLVPAIMAAAPASELPPALASHPLLGPLAAAAACAVEESTGKGEESSGSGRVEWGTWCDTDKFDAVRDELNKLMLVASEDGIWPRLWQIAGGEAASATLRVAGGANYDVLLRLFASPAGSTEDERACTIKYEDGVLTLLKPLLGLSKVEKLRPSGELIGVPKELQGGAAGTKGRAYLQLGGPEQRYAAISSTAALLEVVLRHPTQVRSRGDREAGVLSELRRASEPRARASGGMHAD